MKHNISNILERYLNNESDVAEANMINDWCDYEAGNTDFVLDDNKRLSIADQLKRQIENEIGNRKYTLRSALGMVAAVILIFLSVIFYFSVNPTISSVKYVTRKADIGKNVIIQLSDSTRVTLNSGSEIRYPERFSKERRVYLISGEAYFEVKKNTAKPFIVSAGSLETKVLGTVFNVNYYNYLDHIKVSVKSGKVRVSEISRVKDSVIKAITLLPSEEAIFAKNKHSFTKQNTDASKIGGWLNGDFYFDNEKLSSVVAHLSYRFGKQIILGDNVLNDYRVSLGYKYTDNLEAVIFAIKKSNKLKSIQKGDTLILLNR